MKRIFLFLLVAVLCLGFASTASANANIKFEATQVYYDNSGLLIIKGVFINSGNQDGTVDKAKLAVYLPAGGGERLLAGAEFDSVNARVPAGDVTKWTFRISRVDYVQIQQWRVASDVHYFW